MHAENSDVLLVEHHLGAAAGLLGRAVQHREKPATRLALKPNHFNAIKGGSTILMSIA